jgi:hypothetical protein
MKTNVILTYVKNQLVTNPAWAEKALVRLYELQTADEQNNDTATVQNGQGFNGRDAAFGSSLARWIQSGRRLSQKQLGHAFKMLPKYAGQIMREIPADKLAELEAKLATPVVVEPIQIDTRELENAS